MSEKYDSKYGNKDVKAGNIIQGDKQDFSGSNVAGRDIIQIHNDGNKKSQEIAVPVEGASNFFLDMSKGYWSFLRKGVKETIIALVVPGLISGFISQDVIGTKLITNSYVHAIGFIVLALLIALVSAKYTHNCPKCKQEFAVTEVERILTNKKKVEKNIVENYRVTNSCRHCDYTKTYTDIKEYEPDSN
ncbi:hypothetical protein HQ533_01575 [Candidatus Woesearchaeota archaeon]|nr:hypothetical protein [Candidatus Woesearchaeota archaeon]